MSSADRSSGPFSDSDYNTCAVTPTTTSYALVTTDGRVYRLDDAGNSMSSLKSEKKWNKAMEATSDKDKRMKVRVTGTLEGDTIRVQNAKM